MTPPSTTDSMLPTRPKEAQAGSGPVAMGPGLKDMFLMAKDYRNMNNGSFGTIPRAIQVRQRQYQDMAEARPDPFIRYDYGGRLDQSRLAVAHLVNAPPNSVVFVPNATTGVNTVLRGLAGKWAAEERQPGLPKDEILYFDTIYGACGKSVDYVSDISAGRIAGRQLRIPLPCADQAVADALRQGIKQSRDEGRNPRLAVFDVVSSLPGVCVPWQSLVGVCRDEGLLSLVDGAQGIGMVPLDLSAADPDFFVSNCHKWLHVPRGCAVFYVPERNQHLLPSTLPTSHGYEAVGGTRSNPLPPEEGKSKFVKNFEFVGTVDNAPYLCVKDSIAWRREVLGGEKRILEYLHALAREGGAKVAEMLGTEVLDNETHTISACAMINVALPLVLSGADEEWSATLEENPRTLAVLSPVDAEKAVHWMLRTLIDRHGTFVAMYVYRKRVWARISAQVFLAVDDFVATGKDLQAVCEGVRRGEWKDASA